MATGFDPEAEQEVDFARYGRMLARRWWLVAVGVVAGAVIGYLVSLGSTKLYSATATIYLGQPYNGTTPILTLQTNPSAVGQIANAQSTDDTVASKCGEGFRKGISVQKVASSTPVKGLAAQVSPLVTVTVQASKGKVATCAANALAAAAVAGVATYPAEKIKNLEARITADNTAIQNIDTALADPSLSISEKYFQQSKLAAPQLDLQTSSGLLIVAKQVEMPRLMIPARSHQVSAQSHRSTVLIAALIGLILGVLGALLWDRVVPRWSARS